MTRERDGHGPVSEIGERGLFRGRLWLSGGYFGNYNTPFLPMVALLALGALLWLQVDPTVELFPEKGLDESVSALPATIPD